MIAFLVYTASSIASQYFTQKYEEEANSRWAHIVFPDVEVDEEEKE